MHKKILITGAGGQLGQCLKIASKDFPDFEFYFASKEELDISYEQDLQDFFNKHNFTHCINTAAYTNVEKAEQEPEKAFAINADAVKTLAGICKEEDIVLIHISTDYVFDGKKREPYSENDTPNPINVYGASKLEGEKHIQEIWNKHLIFRTSWLYSQFGHNFYKSILRMVQEGKDMTITTEQTGTPTNANDLAAAILELIAHENEQFGVYHYSNSGETTWYGFAKVILEFHHLNEKVTLAETNHYPTFAQRPEYSVLDNQKRIQQLKLRSQSWQLSLKKIVN